MISVNQVEIEFPDEEFPKAITDGIRLCVNNLILKKLHEDAKRFAPRIVHEIRNPCSIVKNSLENLKQQEPVAKNKNLAVELDRALYGVSKLEEIMSTMMVLDSGSEVKNLTSLTIKQIMEVIKKSSEDLADQFHDCPPVAILAKPFDPSLTIRFEPIQLHQIIFNLLKNAYQARKTQDQSKIRVTIETVHSQFLNISVIDNGPGIPESLRSKIFRSNFTTKIEGHSQGIGLALCRKIAHKNKAELMLDQDSDETKFDLLIPFDAA